MQESDLAAVGPRNLAYDGKSQSGSFWSSGHERLEQALLERFRHVTRRQSRSRRFDASTVTAPPDGVFWIALRIRLSRALCICDTFNFGDVDACSTWNPNVTPFAAASSPWVLTISSTKA
jgi:hypothetical protein